MKYTFFHSFRRILILAVIVCLLAASGISPAKASIASFTNKSAPEGPSPDFKKAQAQPSSPLQTGNLTPQVRKANLGSPESSLPASTEIRQDDSVILGGPSRPDDPLKPAPRAPGTEGKPTSDIPTPAAVDTLQPPERAAGWSTIMSETFEGVFPTGAWNVFDNDGATNGEYYWDDVSFKPYNGSWSAWPAAGGANGLNPAASYYPNYARSWMIYGPFDLSSSTDAELLFYYWNKSESGYDYFGWYASTNGSNFYGTGVSGDSGGWNYVNFDLTSVPTLGNVTGLSSVWIAFIFNSDVSNVDVGPFVDDIVLQKYTPGAQANLAPYTPSGWDYPVVPSNTTGTTTVSTLRTDQPTYIDWAVINNGGDTSTTFTDCLYFDNNPLQCWDITSGLPGGWYNTVNDWVLNLTPTPGAHTLKIVADVYNAINESNESDNVWERSFTWIAAPQPNLTPFTPANWDYPIVPSNTTGTHTVSTLYTNQNTYIDMALINTGAATGTTFATCLYYDNSQLQCWNISGGLLQNQYSYMEDWTLNRTPTPGPHTLRIVVDANNVITESNESDNTWERSFTWTGAPGPSRIFLPLVSKDYVPYFEGPMELEPNNTYLTANGPLRSARDYNGHPDDAKDYFSIYLRNTGPITIDMNNHTGEGVQLQLFYQNTAGSPLVLIYAAPYHIDYTATATGWYYIYIGSTGNFNSSTTYTLRATYP